MKSTSSVGHGTFWELAMLYVTIWIWRWTGPSLHALRCFPPYALFRKAYGHWPNWAVSLGTWRTLEGVVQSGQRFKQNQRTITGKLLWENGKIFHDDSSPATPEHWGTDELKLNVSWRRVLKKKGYSWMQHCMSRMYAKRPSFLW